ncbi:MAG: Acetylornithine deacetylase [Firmicutes bacterium]|nr:Acetylornithine deacetylase [Bacillota bacterium]
MTVRADRYINRDRVIELLTQLVEIYSPYFREKEIMEFAYNWFRERDIPAEYHRYYEKRITNFNGINVVGRIKGNEKGPRILLNGHMDTVEICESWTKNPLKATIEGDRLYGLGSLDMKSGSAAIMLALEAFINTVKDFNGEILYTLVSDEEGPYGLGTDAIIMDGMADGVDVAIVPEPSSGFTGVSFPCLCLGARGGWNYTVEFTGKSAHAANPEQGINAVVEAARVMMELKNSKLITDEKLGTGSICIIKAEGGGAVCSVADKASFTVFRHVVRGESRECLEEELQEAIRRANIKGTAVMKFRDAPHPQNGGFEPYIVEESHPYTQKLQESITAVTGKPGEIAYFSSIGDFNHLGARAKLPTFVFGPWGENYHTGDEYVSLYSVVKTAEVIYDFLCRTLS